MANSTYLQKILGDFKKQHVIFFAIVIICIQLIDTFLKKKSVNVYQVAVVMATYSFINLNMSIYNLLMGGIVSTSVSFIIYKLFVNFSKNINTLALNLVTFLSVIFFMTIFDCVSMPAVAYTLMSPVKIPSSPFSYLSSYIVASFLIILLSILLLTVIKSIKNIKVLHDLKVLNSVTDNTYKQLEENIGSIKQII